MSYFVYRLIPPRPTFDLDMNDQECELMGRHGQYWTRLTQEGKVLVFGPVRDATGAWGLGVIEADDEAQARSMIDADPAVAEGLATFELGPMAAAVLRAGF
jgi:uncharacterized protein YciI